MARGSAPGASAVGPVAGTSSCAAARTETRHSTEQGGFYVFLGNGADSYRFSGRPVDSGVGFVVFGGSGDDSLRGGSRADELSGGGGGDVLRGGPGADRLDGDADERFGRIFRGEVVGKGDDSLAGGPGDDLLSGGAGRDRLDGGAGGDDLAGNDGRDGLDGRGGPDDVDGGANSDVIRGGRGLDVVNYAGTRSKDGRGRRPRLLRGGRVPRPLISFDGRANDGRRGERDKVLAGVEIAFANTGVSFCGTTRPPLCFYAKSTVYRLTRRGTAGANVGRFDGGNHRLEPRRAVTQIDLEEPDYSACPVAAEAAAIPHAAARSLRRLRSSARGRAARFRTKGKHSAATVRGTEWTVEERCDGTFTTVRRGIVVVRDFRLRKNIVLRAGKSYLAARFG